VSSEFSTSPVPFFRLARQHLLVLQEFISSQVPFAGAWKLTNEQAALVEAAGGAHFHFTETQGTAAASPQPPQHQPLSQPQ
jgi:hypothetical protein